MLPRIKAVTFDAGDTLIHLWVHKTRRFAYLCEQIGIPPLAPDAAKLAAVACERFFQERYKGPSKHLEWWLNYHIVGLQAAGVQGNLRELAQAIHEVWNQLPETWVLDPETIITLDCLRQRGIRLGVISNWDGNLRQILQDLNILSYFEMVLDSHIVGVRKPDPAIFRMFSQACKLEPAQCIHVGDSPDADESMALSVGAISLLYDPLECLPSKGGHRISELSDVVKFLDKVL
ncbi:hydrolase [Dictyobacter sp. S3.2.2.5]|uniref:Hydrolase n=1 Tax=Dictyobacter halimunensis TaxID=3026934 RepID=A0ABQ6FZT8_9CHLR|nr:hydrolase [Dictyobacter sp. S3.2.2.5]